MDSIRALFEDYQKELGLDLCFQGFEKELNELPGVYAEPEGCILIAEVDGEIAGVVALKSLGQGISEMKRLYVKPSFRSLKLGRKLAEALIEEARSKRYQTMKLDTLSRLQSAISLYESLGFTETSAYNYNPDETVKYFKIEL
ncbi:GNAT family N-acetyltransferase [Marinilongibacter aquaticus]|uniref:GNAT family N-acetyltransferase n=1 Tax=Marinilongibacter aquaticus TaxID=2975157 RepID=UPI0021BD61CC|nr:GNAT family N-acetyltransferase [Marinilongibacter aquaticus]UBM59412.1 GNAT family N-acetyltransferase [Marinilongibacter aquaticus]